jgi:hypothetical protein
LSFLELHGTKLRNLVDNFDYILDQAISDKNILELQHPTSVIEWAASGKFLGLKAIYDNRGQYYALREFFQCYCPLCSSISGEEVFEVDKKELFRDKLLVLDNHKEYCPDCGLDKETMLNEGLLNNYNILLGVIGMRAGKTMLASIAMTFFEQYLISTGDIKRFLELEKAPHIEICCLAVSGKQTKDTIWAQYSSLRKETEWFKNLDEQMRELGFFKDGSYNILADEVNNEVCGYKVEGMNSSSATLAGRTRILYVIDELGRFDTTESKRSASEIWRVGNHSLKTVRKIVKDKKLPYWLGSLIGIESPISVDDYGMKKLDSKSENMFKMKFSTWDFNREYEQEDFKEEFEDDYYGATRDYGADPPGSAIPFIEDWELFREFVEDKEIQPHLQFIDTERYVGEVCYLGKNLSFGTLDLGEWFIACDAGKSRDTFAIVGCKREWTDNGEVRLVHRFSTHILPNASMKRYVDFLCVEGLLEDICKKLRVSRICFDYWQSETVVQSLQRKGYNVEQYAMSSVRLADFFSFKNASMQGKIKILPRNGSEDGENKLMDSDTRLYWEMKRMERDKNLTKVDHNKNSTSDLFECIVNCYRMMTEGFDKKNPGSYGGSQGRGDRVIGSVTKFRRW